MASQAAWLRVLDGAVELRIKVVPRASRSRIAGVTGDRLKVQVTAPPVDGEANDAVIELLAAEAGTARRDVALVAGATGRSKTVRIASPQADSVAKKLLEAAARTR